MFKYQLLLLLSILIVIVSCQPARQPQNRATTSVKPKYLVTGQEGGIVGSVKFTGTPPPPTALQFDADNYCLANATIKSSETVIVNNGKLQNVLISIKAGPATNYSYDPPDRPARLDQQACRYQPHVQGLMIGQSLQIANSDDTDHNVQLLSKFSEASNESQQRNAPPLVKSFAQPEIIPVKCKVHPWMYAYLGVFEDPFYAVSDADGSFQIQGLPPGDYIIEAWHESLGKQQQNLTVVAKATSTIEFNYQPAR